MSALPSPEYRRIFGILARVDPDAARLLARLKEQGPDAAKAPAGWLAERGACLERLVSMAVRHFYWRRSSRAGLELRLSEWLIDRAGEVDLPRVGAGRSASAGSVMTRHGVQGPPGRDVFISYPFVSVSRVLPLVEALVAAGVSVWFSEYEVLLDNYEDHEREIAEGIARCRFALCFTNTAYDRSKWCGDECRGLIDALGEDRGRVLQLCTLAPDDPPYRGHDALGGMPTLAFDGDVPAALQFIARHTGLELRGSRYPLPTSPRQQLQLPAVDLRADTTGFVLDKPWPSDPDGEPLHLLARDAPDRLRVTIRSRRPRTARDDILPVAEADGRYDEYGGVVNVQRQRAMEWMRGFMDVHPWDVTLRGLHLKVHDRPGWTALTWFERDHFVRHYSLLVGGDETRQHEVLVTARAPGSFAQFCQIMPAVHALVGSLSDRPLAHDETPRASFLRRRRAFRPRALSQGTTAARKSEDIPQGESLQALMQGRPARPPEALVGHRLSQENPQNDWQDRVRPKSRGR